jgi:DNA helicase IV
LHPLDALGLAWPHVVVVEPERILAEHGEAALFVAATRAIDRLTVVDGTNPAG